MSYMYYHPHLAEKAEPEFDVLEEAIELLGYALRRWPEGWDVEMHTLIKTDPEEAYAKLCLLCEAEGIEGDLSPAVLWTYFNYELNALFSLEPATLVAVMQDITKGNKQYLVNFLGSLSTAYYLNSSYNDSGGTWIVGSKHVSNTKFEESVVQLWIVKRDSIDALMP